MTDSGACENCGTAVVRHGQNWTHITGSLRCPGSHWKGDGFAVLAEPCPDEDVLYETVRDEVADDVREDVLGEATSVLRMKGYTDAAAIVGAL